MTQADQRRRFQVELTRRAGGFDGLLADGLSTGVVAKQMRKATAIAAHIAFGALIANLVADNADSFKVVRAADNRRIAWRRAHGPKCNVFETLMAISRLMVKLCAR